MPSGTWSPTDLPLRPGLYMNFVAAALAAIAGGPRGVVAIPVKANWGPPKTIVEITSEQDLIDNFNIETLADGYTAHDCIWLCLLGAPQKILGYRLVDGSATKATITLQDGVAANVLTLATKYPTTRAFNVTTRDNAVDPTNKQDMVLFEGTTQLYVFTYAKGAAVVDNAVAAISGDPKNVWIDPTKVAAGNGVIANVSNQALAGGNAGIAAVANQDYTDAMTAFAGQDFNAFALDGATDSSLQASVSAWVASQRTAGKKIISYMGGTAANDTAGIATANTRSTGFNFEGVVNVGVSGIMGGVTYCSAQVACYIAGLASGQALKESLTYAATPFSDVTPRLSNDDINSAIASGTLVLVNYGGVVKVEKGINTLTNLSADQGVGWKKVKVIRIMDAIATDTAAAAADSYIGKVLNNSDGQTAVLNAIKNYFETMVPDLLNANFTVQTDTAKQATAGTDQFFWKYSATIVDSMEQIFGTGYIS